MLGGYEEICAQEHEFGFLALMCTVWLVRLILAVLSKPQPPAVL